MIIEHSETLRTWLTNTLSPICDADPAALAKYVMALLKKDKPEQELKDFCIDQLDVFLQKETKSFVEQLFVVIRDKSYLNPSVNVKQEFPSPSIANVSSGVSAPVAVTPEINLHMSGDISRISSSSKDVEDRAGQTSVRRRSREERPMKRSRSSTKSRSRSRSKDRNRKLVAEKPSSLRQHGSGGGASAIVVGSRDRDKENRESRHGRQNSPKERKRPLSRERIRQRSRDGTPISENNSLPVGSMDGSPPETERVRIVDKDKKRKRQRCRDYDEKGYCMRGDSCQYDHGPDPVVVEEVSLPRMITMKAPPPPVDFSLPPPGYNPVPPPPGVEHGFTAATEAYNPEAPSISSSTTSTAPANLNSAAYGPPLPQMWNHPPPNYNLPFGNVKQPYRSRELITLAEGEQQQQPSMMSTVRIVGGPSSYGFRPDKRHLPSRQPPNMSQVPYDKTNCTLEVRRIPTSFNTIAKLNEHFSQFGQIINIQVRYQNDPEAALVTFSNRQQAVTAYKSTAPIFNNRFIRMFWHNKDGTIGEPSSERPSVKDRLGPAPLDPSTSVDDSSMKPRSVDPSEDADGNRRSVLLTTTGGLSKTVYNPAALKSAAAAVQLSQDAFAPQQPLPAVQQPVQTQRISLAKRHLQMEKEVYKKQVELQRAKSDLFAKQIEQQKTLIRQLDKCKLPAQRKEILKTIKVVEKSIKQLKDELHEIKLPPPPSTKTKEQVERNLLDTELEMINQQQSGGDTTDLHRRLLDLRREVMILNEMTMVGGVNTSTPVQQMNNSQGNAGARGGRPPRRIPAHTVLDKRPRDLMIVGFTANEKDLLIEHLQEFGVLEDIEFLHQLKDQPYRALVVYKFRKDAEKALAKGKEFQNKVLDIQWFNRRSQIPSEKDDSKAEMTAQDILATLDDEDDVSSDDNQGGEFDEDVPEIERGWKR